MAEIIKKDCEHCLQEMELITLNNDEVLKIIRCKNCNKLNLYYGLHFEDDIECMDYIDKVINDLYCLDCNKY